MMAVPLVWPEVRRAGLEALRERLGMAGTMYFLQMTGTGTGDYTKERREWVDRLTLDEIAEGISQSRSGQG